MNRTTKIFGAAVALTMMGTGGAWAADCGTRPPVPALAGTDGSKLTGKEMEKLATDFDEFQTKFVTFSDCINKEFNESTAAFKTVMTAYQDKNKKK